MRKHLYIDEEPVRDDQRRRRGRRRGNWRPAEQTPHGVRGRQVRGLSRRDGAPRVLARAAQLRGSALRPRLHPRRPRLDPARRANPSLVARKGANHEGGPMTIRRRCTDRKCKKGRRCLEQLRFDMMWRGKRYRVPVNEFAIPRMEPGKQRPIQSMEEARDGNAVRRRGESRSPSRRHSSRCRRAAKCAKYRRSSTPTSSGAPSPQACAASRRFGAASAAQRAPRRTAAGGARRTGRDQPVQGRLRVRRGRRDCLDASRARTAAGGDELGDGADAAAVHGRRSTGSACG